MPSEEQRLFGRARDPGLRILRLARWCWTNAGASPAGLTVNATAGVFHPDVASRGTE